MSYRPEQVANFPISQRKHRWSDILANGMSVQTVVPAEKRDGNDPATFHRIMQSMVGDRLKARYQPPKKLSHELFVLILQLKDREHSAKKAGRRKAKSARAKPRRSVAASL